MAGALHSDAYKRFLKALVAFRVDRSVSQAELARRLDRPPSWVAKNELGERRIDPIELAEIAVALGESPRAIFQIVEDAVAISDQNKTKS